MPATTDRACGGAGRLRRLVSRTLLVVGGAVAGTVVGWAVCTASASASAGPPAGLPAAEPVMFAMADGPANVVDDGVAGAQALGRCTSAEDCADADDAAGQPAGVGRIPGGDVPGGSVDPVERFATRLLRPLADPAEGSLPDGLLPPHPGGASSALDQLRAVGAAIHAGGFPGMFDMVTDHGARTLLSGHADQFRRAPAPGEQAARSAVRSTVPEQVMAARSFDHAAVRTGRTGHHPGLPVRAPRTPVPWPLAPVSPPVDTPAPCTCGHPGPGVSGGPTANPGPADMPGPGLTTAWDANSRVARPALAPELQPGTTPD